MHPGHIAPQSNVGRQLVQFPTDREIVPLV
jgi:hypothetical protein